MIVYSTNTDIKSVTTVVGLGAEKLELNLVASQYKNNYLPDNVVVSGLRPNLTTGHELTVSNFCDVVNSETLAYVYNVCNYYRDKQGRTPYVVLPMCCRSTIDKAYGFIETVSMYNRMYNISPTFVIENSLPWSHGLFNNGFYKEPVKFVSLCLQIDNTVSLCNMLNISNASKSIELLSNFKDAQLSYRNYIDTYKKTCKVACLSYGRATEEEYDVANCLSYDSSKYTVFNIDVQLSVLPPLRNVVGGL